MRATLTSARLWSANGCTKHLRLVRIVANQLAERLEPGIAGTEECTTHVQEIMQLLPSALATLDANYARKL